MKQIVLHLSRDTYLPGISTKTLILKNECNTLFKLILFKFSSNISLKITEEFYKMNGKNAGNIIIIPMSIIFPIHETEDKVLLGEGKQTKAIGAGQLNGYGGKQKPVETIRSCAAREYEEETTIKLSGKLFKKLAVIDFYKHCQNNRIELRQCTIFSVGLKDDHIYQPTEEMVSHELHNISNLPFHRMMNDAPYWIAQLLRGEIAGAEFHRNEDKAFIAEPKIISKNKIR